MGGPWCTFQAKRSASAKIWDRTYWQPLVIVGVFGRRRKARGRSDNAVGVFCATLKSKHLIFRIMRGF